MTSNESQDQAAKTRARWLAAAGSLQRRVNFHHWLSRLLPVATAVCAVFACLLLWVRSEEMATQPWWGAFAVAMVLAAAGAVWLSRKSWISRDEALVRLESEHRLHNQLSAAQEGVMPWPEVPATLNDGFRLRYQRVLVPPAAAAVFLLAASLVYLPAKEVETPAPVAAPRAWEEAQRMIDQLKEEELFAQEQLEQYENKLDALRDQPQQEWYEHGSLEAGESLKSDMRNAVEETARNMEWAEQTLNEMQKEAEKDEGSLEELSPELQQATEGLEMGDLPLDQQTLQQLKQMAQSINPRELSQEQMEKLKQKLREGTQTCQNCLGEGQGLAEALRNAEQVRRKRPGEKGDEEGPPGGITRGPGHQPLALMQEPSDAENNRLEKVDNTDLSRATLGETQALEARQHRTDPSTYQGPTSAGQVEAKGSGGETVWRDSFTPEENQVLQKYFR
ncbi:MAG: hypothetical protein AAGK14_08830 [Verrucomicrobiota bacterium]